MCFPNNVLSSLHTLSRLLFLGYFLGVLSDFLFEYTVTVRRLLVALHDCVCLQQDLWFHPIFCLIFLHFLLTERFKAWSAFGEGVIYGQEDKAVQGKLNIPG